MPGLTTGPGSRDVMRIPWARFSGGKCHFNQGYLNILQKSSNVNSLFVPEDSMILLSRPEGQAESVMSKRPACSLVTGLTAHACSPARGPVLASKPRVQPGHGSRVQPGKRPGSRVQALFHRMKFKLRSRVQPGERQAGPESRVQPGGSDWILCRNPLTRSLGRGDIRE